MLFRSQSPSGKSAVYDGEIIVDSAEATIEDDQSTRYYMTLQQAVDAAEDDETVVVAKDLSASGAEYLVTLDDESKTVTVDLNGKTLLYTGSGTGSNQQNGEAISVNAGKLVLKNGTVNMVNDEADGCRRTPHGVRPRSRFYSALQGVRRSDSR